MSSIGEIPVEAALASYFECLDRGEAVDEARFIARYPDLTVELSKFFNCQRGVNAQVLHLCMREGSSNQFRVRCPSCHESTNVAADSTLTNLVCSACGSQFNVIDESIATADAPKLLTIGRFTFLERLGMGTFGTVWKARDESLDRVVAVKVPRQTGMSAQEQEKFFREARAAAQLRHPNIVSIHEVGRDDKSVFIVSDFVQGVTLADWITGQLPSSREAAELCALIANALEHAHSKGVIHRDLKPANIMIDGTGAPYIMDFGLARRDVGEVTMTIEGQVLGTPAYMSPEQAEGNGHAADRRSDVYSLGVILFQLLTGELPFRGNVRMIMHQVINDEPPSPRKLNANICRDLETITLKCLEKDPSRRYSSASDVAAELRSFLAGKPIKARPIGALARTGRWIRRNRAVSALTLSIFLALALGAALSTKFALSAGAAAKNALIAKTTAENAQALAVARQKESEAVTDFLVNALKSAHPANKSYDVKVVDLLDQASKDAEAKFADQPRLQATVLNSIAGSWLGLGKWKQAITSYERALALRRDTLGDDHEDTLNTMFNLSYVYYASGRYKESVALDEEQLAIYIPKVGSDDEQVLQIRVSIARNNEKLGRRKEAIEQLEAVCRDSQKRLSEHSGIRLRATAALAGIYSATKQTDKAIEMRQYVLERRLADNARDDMILAARAGVAAAYYHDKQYDRAIELYTTEVIPAQTKDFGPDHTDTINSKQVVANSYLFTGRIEEAVRWWEEIVATRKKVSGADDPVTLQTMQNLATAYGRANRPSDVRVVFEEIVANCDDKPELLNWVAWSYAVSKVDAVRDGKRAVELATKACELTQYKDPAILDTLAAGYAETGDMNSAIKWSEKSVEAVPSNNPTMKAALSATLEEFRDRKRTMDSKAN